MNAERDEVPVDAMQVHPDWRHIETLSIHPDCDTLVIVPGHALFRSTTDPRKPDFDPHSVALWSLNEFQDEYELRLIIEHIHTGILTTTHLPHSIIVFSGGCTRPEGDGWTEGESYYSVAEYYDWWESETKIPTYLMKAKAYVDVYSFDSMDNLYMSILSFQMMHPRQEVPKKVVVIGCKFKQARYKMHAQALGIPEFEYIAMEDPLNIDDNALARERAIVEFYKRDPFGEDLQSEVWKKKFRRNFKGLENPYGTARGVHESYKNQFNLRVTG